MRYGQKHLVKCRCVLPNLLSSPNPQQHQFVVFSIVEDDVVKTKFVQCNNCGVVHKVVDICKSEIMNGKESLSSIIKKEDLRASLPTGLVQILDVNDVDLHGWEAAKFIIDEKRWGDFVVLQSDTSDGMKQGKYVRILGETLFKVDSFVREDS
jgi:hypothetical protein